MEVSGKFPITSQNAQDGIRSERGDFFKTLPGQLQLEDGQIFAGQAPDWQTQSFAGEVVFNTGMTGYVESLTDPSYNGQILVFTYPLIGNYGVDLHSAESGKIQAAGVVVSQLATYWSHSAADRSFAEWLRSQNVPLLMGIDTRALTKYLRTRGTMQGLITPKNATISEVILPDRDFLLKQPIEYGQGNPKTVILVDCGAKANIARSLQGLSLHVKQVPHDYDYTKEAFDGVVLSNGPGDPTDYEATIQIVKRAFKLGKPVFGICLGSQIMALAAGAKTYKLKYGHRGHNQPCLEDSSGRCYITSQNHGYAIDEASLPAGWLVNFRNLNDNSVEGIRHQTKPFFSVQFHPEACPGPTDTAWLFERFYELL